MAVVIRANLGGMAQTVSIIISPEDRARLAAVIADRNSPQKHVQRARIVLHSGEHLPVIEVARHVGASRRYIRDHNGQAKPFVWTKTAELIFEKLSRLPAHNM